MLDIQFIRTHTSDVREAITQKQIDLDLDALLRLDEERRSLIQERDALLAERNRLDVATAKERGPKIKDELHTIEPRLAEVEAQFHNLLLLVPQIPATDVPVGDASASVEVRQWGEPPVFDFAPKDHMHLGTSLDLIDLERGVEVSGFRGYYLKNEAVLIHYGLMQLGLELMRARGFTLMATPTKIREFALVGSGHFPAGRAEVYQIGNAARLRDESEKEDAFLAGTAEPSLLAYYAHQTVDERELPIRVCGISPCYRSEIGGYGQDTKGLYRIHEFMKVEQVVIAPADEAVQQQLFDEMLAIAEELLQSLELPYHVIDTATGDMGVGKVRMYDIETWMPSRASYGETHSCSMLGDWQARRLGIKYRAADGEKRYAYTLNNTVIASPRILIALLENFQQADGSVRIPKPLQRFVGTDRLTSKERS
ncbi:serine--tRNA ligase [Candidatus Berkelbacteria bacterium]|nr:serine--tRNA ligase [Candidatus Berkelbacteria bacterium]